MPTACASRIRITGASRRRGSRCRSAQASPGSGRRDASFSTYLHRIVVNVAYEHLERRRRGRGRNEPLEDRQLETLIAPGASPEQRAREREQLRRVFSQLDHLSPKRRGAFVLVAIECL